MVLSTQGLGLQKVASLACRNRDGVLERSYAGTERIFGEMKSKIAHRSPKE